MKYGPTVPEPMYAPGDTISSDAGTLVLTSNGTWATSGKITCSTKDISSDDTSLPPTRQERRAMDRRRAKDNRRKARRNRP